MKYRRLIFGILALATLVATIYLSVTGEWIIGAATLILTVIFLHISGVKFGSLSFALTMISYYFFYIGWSGIETIPESVIFNRSLAIALVIVAMATVHAENKLP